MQNTHPKYPTGIKTNLTGPEGNIFYLMGICNKLINQIDLRAEERKQFETELLGKNYEERLNVMTKWFGIEFIHQ